MPGSGQQVGGFLGEVTRRPNTVWWPHSSVTVPTPWDCARSPGDLGLSGVVVETGECGCPSLPSQGSQLVPVPGPLGSLGSSKSSK